MKKQPDSPNRPFGHYSEEERKQIFQEHLNDYKDDPSPPSFNELWGRAVEALEELMEAYPEEYQKGLKHSKAVPLLMPRDRGEDKEFLDKLKEDGVKVAWRGKPRDESHPITKAVNNAFKKISGMRFQAKMRAYSSKEPIAVDKFLINLPPMKMGNDLKGWVWCMELIFLQSYDGKPHKSKDFKEMLEGNYLTDVKTRVEKDDSKKFTEDNVLNEIKKDFRKAIPPLANYYSELYGGG